MQGRFLYLVARSLGAKRIVEFGTSFGISTLYAAAAARDEGGQVIGSELEPSKQRAATAHLAEAGLASFAEVRLGDARETLRDVPGPIDLVLLDGWKELYLPMLQMLAPKLRPGRGRARRQHQDLPPRARALRRLRAERTQRIRQRDASARGWLRVLRAARLTSRALNPALRPSDSVGRARRRAPEGRLAATHPRARRPARAAGRGRARRERGPAASPLDALIQRSGLDAQLTHFEAGDAARHQRSARDAAAARRAKT